MYHNVFYRSSNPDIFKIFIELFPQHNYSTRNDQINYPKFRLEVERKFVIYQIIKIINEFPKDLLVPQSCYMLKKKFKLLILSKYLLELNG